MAGEAVGSDRAVEGVALLVWQALAWEAKEGVEMGVEGILLIWVCGSVQQLGA